MRVALVALMLSFVVSAFGTDRKDGTLNYGREETDRKAVWVDERSSSVPFSLCTDKHHSPYLDVPQIGTDGVYNAYVTPIQVYNRWYRWSIGEALIQIRNNPGLVIVATGDVYRERELDLGDVIGNASPPYRMTAADKTFVVWPEGHASRVIDIAKAAKRLGRWHWRTPAEKFVAQAIEQVRKDPALKYEVLGRKLQLPCAPSVAATDDKPPASGEER